MPGTFHHVDVRDTVADRAVAVEMFAVAAGAAA